LPYNKESLYAHYCSVNAPFTRPENESCNELLGFLTTLNDYAHHTLHLTSKRSNKWEIYANDLAKLFHGHLITFPKHESKEVYQNLINGRKVLIVGLNTDIDDILSQLKEEYPRTAFFRGKEKLWPHNKNWQFLQISYNQPRVELVQLMAAGIYQFWRYWLRDRKHFETELKEAAQDSSYPLSLRSNASFMFVVLCIGLGTAVCIFLTENTYFRLKNYKIRQRVQIAYRNSISQIRRSIACLRMLGLAM